MKKKLLEINERIKRISELYEEHEKEQEELIRNIIKGAELDRRLDQIQELLRGVEEELEKEKMGK
ncbi:hypothetical protein PM10SUCC1_02010 [Propionigenium maris DSM 9537]|uniref:Uncharacterized protein n=1 Tax=Propionigenium maris DSM 9537 TaxID=1123000 RepID=A0A9W6GIW6_9FUSO|nr:hypothetical protein [Propionigenium maris]GLI54686.1 hypothetical protein PM10SUCC1_02010 [Propionigenium maris DSM 9537]